MAGAAVRPSGTRIRSLCEPSPTQRWARLIDDTALRRDDIPDKLRADLFYIENWSLFMDIAVRLKTAAEVLFYKAAA